MGYGLHSRSFYFEKHVVYDFNLYVVDYARDHSVALPVQIARRVVPWGHRGRWHL